MDVRLDIDGAVALITLDDGKKNAISPAAIAGINAALDEAEAKAGAIVLAGRPGCFSAGFDLNVMRGGDLKAMATLVADGGRIAHRLYANKLPTVAAATGHALAAGALFLLACDTRIGEQGDWKLGLNETAIGMSLPGWALALAEARLNPMQFTRLVTQAGIVGPGDAVTGGYLDSTVRADEAVAAALATAAQLAELPGEAYAANKLRSRAGTLAAMDADLNG